MEAADLLLENEEFVTFTQSAEWQNAMKNEELVNYLKSDEFSSSISKAGDIQKLAIMNQYFDSVKLALVNARDLNEVSSKEVFASNTFENFLGSRDFSGWGRPFSIMWWLNNQDFQQLIRMAFSQEFQKMLANPANIEALDFSSFMMKCYTNNSSFNKYFSQDFQKLVNSQDYQNLVNTQDYQQLVNTQDYQKLVNSQDYQKLLGTQNYQELMNSQEFQNLIQNDFFESIWNSNQDFQKNMLGAFQDYMQDVHLL
jgi:tripartite-type tricarboxylate transporter receptor subunit TctC